MRIVIEARESGTTTGRYMDKLIEYVHKLEPKHEIIVLTKPHRLEFMQSIAPNFTVVPCPIKEFTFAEQLKMPWQIKRLKPDLVHFTIVQQPVLYPGRVITTMQDLTTARFRNPTKNWFIFTFKREVYKLVNKVVAKKSKLLITPTEFVKQDVMSYCHVPADKITVTLESADKITEAAKPLKHIPSQFMLYVGRPFPHKNLERLVDAFAILRQTHPDLHLVFVGKLDSMYRHLQKYAKQVDGVIFTDFVSDAQLRWLYEHAAVYAFPSLSEGFGLPPLEAMHYGVPVVSSNATCLPEVQKDAALYFDPLNVTDMAAKIGQVLDDPKLAEELTTKGTALVKTYSWKRMAEQTLAVYDKALKN